MLQYSNFAKTTMDEDLTDVETSLTVVDASNFPASGTGYFMMVFWEAEYSSPLSSPNVEIVKCLGYFGASEFFIQRAQESTTAVAWSTGDHVALVLTAGMLDEIEEEIGAGVSHNLLFNTGFLNRISATAAPTGWIKYGAGTATYSYGSGGIYGPNYLAIAASGGEVMFYQTPSTFFPSYTSHSTIQSAVYAKVGGAGQQAYLHVINSGSPPTSAASTSITATSTTLYRCVVQGGDSFGVTVENGSTLTIVSPTLVRTRADIMPGPGLLDAGMYRYYSGRHMSVSSIISASGTYSINMAEFGYDYNASNGIIFSTCAFSTIGGSSMKYGIIELVNNVSSGTIYGGPVRIVSNDSNAYVSLTVAASKVSVTLSTPNLTITNNTADSIIFTFTTERGW